MTSFAPAVKAQLKARVALAGPTGSGKTWTALEFATVLAAGEKIALIDTERDSARLYANHFAFDVARFDPPYEVNRLVDMLREADTAGYGCIVVDSLSHFWEGEGGVLDEVDAAASRSFGGSTFAGWKHGTPLQRHMVDTFLGMEAHVVIAMRSKMEYVLVDYVGKDGKTRTKPEKVGMAPVQRAGLEYEFTIVGDMDLEHRITISKSRCDVLADKVIQPHRATEAAKTFLEWLNDGTPPPPKADPELIAGITAAFDAITDEAERKRSKGDFFELFGAPAALLEAQTAAALEFVRELQDVGAGDDGATSDAPGALDGASDPSPAPDGLVPA